MASEAVGQLSELGKNQRLEAFFRFLSERLRGENDASDILYAAFKASSEFRAVVVDCLGLPSTGPPPEVTREFSIESARPDFVVNCGEEIFLVEVKLFDRNYHYEEYCKLMVGEPRRPPTSIVLLTAHTPDRDLPGWHVVPWSELIERLERTEDEFNRAVTHYFRRATMSERLEPISLGRPRGILYLNRALKRVIESYGSDGFTARVYNGYKDSFSEVSSGYYYELKHRSEQDRSAWPCFCLIYTDESEGEREGIELGLRKDHKNYDRMYNALRQLYGKQLRNNEWGCYVDMASADFETLISCGDKDKQLQMLGRFFEEFNRTIEPCV